MKARALKKVAAYKALPSLPHNRSTRQPLDCLGQHQRLAGVPSFALRRAGLFSPDEHTFVPNLEIFNARRSPCAIPCYIHLKYGRWKLPPALFDKQHAVTHR